MGLAGAIARDLGDHDLPLQEDRCGARACARTDLDSFERALERLVIVARGVDEKSLVVPEAAHLELRPAYEGRLRGYAEDGAAGVHAWLLYAAEAVGVATEASPLRQG